jgi:hypothetical protein
LRELFCGRWPGENGEKAKHLAGTPLMIIVRP